ncbi:MAG: hypothetical protein MZV70_36050 [Desulfobacterales bacterium]|nr:hypothetical protein [Desulfobacterales bacterium]
MRGYMTIQEASEATKMELKAFYPKVPDPGRCPPGYEDEGDRPQGAGGVRFPQGEGCPEVKFHRPPSLP